MTAAEVLHRYKRDEMPEFVGVPLDDVNQIGNSGDRPLHIACVRGKMDEIAALVGAGAEVNAPGDMANTPLHECVGQGHLMAVQFLLDHGASPSAKNEWGASPIDVARLKGREDMVKILTQPPEGAS